MDGLAFIGARHKEFLRQAYIDHVDLSGYDCVGRVVYDPSLENVNKRMDQLVLEGHLELSMVPFEKHHASQSLFMVLTPPKSMGSGIRSTVYVFPRAFRPCYDEDMFLSGLVYHEFFHCEDFHNGISSSNGVFIGQENVAQLQHATLKCLLELRAHRNQYNYGIKSGIGGDYLDMISVQFHSYLADLCQIAPKNSFEESVLDNIASFYEYL